MNNKLNVNRVLKTKGNFKTWFQKQPNLEICTSGEHKTGEHKTGLKMRSNTRSGVTAVEFALVAPLLLITIFAGVEFVRANIIRHTIENAAYSASRAVMVPGATKAEAIDKANSLLSLVGIMEAEIEFKPTTISEDTKFVSTTISVPMSKNSWGMSAFMGDTTLIVESVIRTERAPNIQARALPTILNPPPKPPKPPEPTKPKPTEVPDPPTPPKPTTPKPPSPPKPKKVLL